MKLTIELRIEGDAAMPLTVPIQIIDHHVQDVGLTVAEAKAILGRGRLRMIKGHHPLRFRTAYRDVPLHSAPWFRCRCEISRSRVRAPFRFAPVQLARPSRLPDGKAAAASLEGNEIALRTYSRLTTFRAR